MEYLIIGNSVAGIAAAEAVRAQDRNGNITILSKENHYAYGRPLISYLLAGKTSEDKIYLRDMAFYEKKKFNILLDCEADKVDTDKKEVTLTDGKKMKYDKLLLATGGTPIHLPIEDVKAEGIYHFNTLDDALEIEKILEGVKKAVVIGGGLIGLKTSEALSERGVEVTMVELMSSVLPMVLDEESAEIFADGLVDDRIRLELNNSVEKVLAKKRIVSGVSLKYGGAIECDLVIVAVGVRPNITLTEGTKIKVNRGIIVDKKMQTNIEDVYAAGDVAEAYDMLYKENRNVPIWPSAYRQGEVAGKNMSGSEEEYDGTCTMNSIGYKTIHMISIGIINPEEEGIEIIKRYERKKGIYKRFNIVDNKIIGAVFVGDVTNKGITTNLIKKGVDVSQYKDRLLEDNFGLVDIDKEFRRELMKK